MILNQIVFGFRGTILPKMWNGEWKKSFDFAVDDHKSSSNVIRHQDKINKAMHILLLLTQILVAHNKFRILL